MIGTMGSFAYPSAGLNDPMWVLFRALSHALVAESKPQDMLGVHEAFDTPQLVLRLHFLSLPSDADQNMRRDCYLHGYVSSGVMKQARENPKDGLAITIAATKVDGIVLSLTPNSHSYNYQSAVLFGFGSLVEVCILSVQILPFF